VLIGVAVGFAGSAALATALATNVLRHHLLSWGIIDAPNHRSSHTVVVARGAGVGMAGVWVVVSAIALVSLGRFNGALTVIAMTAALAGLGFVDDRSSLSPSVRLAAQIAICGVAAATGLGGTNVLLPGGGEVEIGILAVPLWTILLVTVINLFNFMDGIDGLAAGQTLISALALTGLGLLSGLEPLTALSAALAGVAAGFLVFNWSPARCFMGDAGSYFCGAAIGGLWLLGQQQGFSLALSASSATLFLLDAMLTLLTRAVRGKPFWRPHRDHVYQRLTSRWSHARVTAMYLSAGVLTGAIGLGFYAVIR
jgi:UDP-N-acetylmuramyl pentapeptide phosphotransferase/UDP-N-acetylglucosamine-1-phosphate transferase